MPIFAAEILHAGADGLGILMAGSGLGSIAGALFVASRTSRGPGFMRTITTVCGSALGVSLLAFALSQNLWLSFTLSATSGALTIALAASANTYIQLLVPDHLRGRTMSLYTTMFVGAVPLGHLFNGLVAGKLGASTAVGLAGLATLGGTLLLSRRLPRGSVDAEGAAGA
jgi:hypothetical protein